MLRPVEKAEKIKRDAKSLYKQVSKAYQLIEAYEVSNEKKNQELEDFIKVQSAHQYSGALQTGANNLQKVLQGTITGKIPTEEALKNIKTINISVMTAEMVASEILADGKQTALDEERF